MARLIAPASEHQVIRSARHQLGALILASVVFLGGGIIAAQTVTRSINDLIVATATARLQSEATLSVLSALKDAETGQRGFLLTNRAVYLEPYEVALTQVQARLDNLLRLAHDTPWLRDDHARLVDLATAKIDELKRTVALASAHDLPAAIAIVNNDSGKSTMDAIRSLTAKIVSRADAERGIRANRLQAEQRQFTTLLLAGLGAGIALLAALVAVMIANRTRLLAARANEQRVAQRLHATVEHIPEGVAVFDRASRLVAINTRFATTIGIDPSLAQPGTEYATLAAAAHLDPPALDGPADATARMIEARQGPRSLEIWRSRLPDGGQLIAVSDITRRVAAEEVARQSQKMDVLGQMTGGVAHDFNNLLQVVSANLELLRNRLERMPGTEALLTRLDAASGGVARGAKLTRHLLAFARRQPLAPEPIDAARLLIGMEDSLRRTVGEGIHLELVIGGGLWFLRADPVQLENALLNLTLNARDAMAGPYGAPQGRLTIEAANAALDEDYAARTAEVSPGQYVMFAVTDTGVGMTADQRARAIEPFYTTKPEGRGTGLGLPMVLGFAKQSGGHFQLYSEPGSGTTARLYIPRTTAPAQQPAPRTMDLPLGSGQLVLLVEDDAAVRRVARDALAALNYQVIEADSGDAALVLLEGGCKPRLLFTDVVMPGKVPARQMADRARILVPGLGVLFTSGYTQNSIVHNGQLDADVALISKPWRTDELARAIRAVLLGTARRPEPRRRVLLVEDEELVRRTTADALAELGFEVAEAATAAAALARLDPPPDLLLTDFGLPDRDGVSLVAEIRARLPGLPVILSSGRAAPLPGGDMVWLAKPYDVQTLRRAVMQALEREPGAER